MRETGEKLDILRSESHRSAGIFARRRAPESYSFELHNSSSDVIGLCLMDVSISKSVSGVGETRVVISYSERFLKQKTIHT